jgi:hypothetical protein
MPLSLRFIHVALEAATGSRFVRQRCKGSRTKEPGGFQVVGGKVTRVFSLRVCAVADSPEMDAKYKIFKGNGQTVVDLVSLFATRN